MLKLFGNRKRQWGRDSNMMKNTENKLSKRFGVTNRGLGNYKVPENNMGI